MNVRSLMFPLWFLLLHGNKTSAGQQLTVVHQFIVPKYVDGSPDNYIEKNAAIVDVDYWKDKASNVEKIFVTTPRQKAGVPASLSIVIKENLESKLSPYPSWEANKATCDGIVSAFRTMVDSCDRLWVIDTGVIESATDNSERICTPKVWIFDLKTDKLISTHPIPNELLKGDSLLITIVVDIRDKNKCDEAFAYIADTQTFQIIVFDMKNDKFWQFRNRYMFPTPADGNFNINGVSFDLMDGVLGLSLGPVKKGDRILYFHSLASKRESCVPASALRNSSLAGDLNSARQYFKISTEERTSQSAAEAMTDNGVQFFGLLEENTLACWASKPTFRDYRRTNVVRLKTDNELLQFISGIKVVGDNLFILSSRLQDYFTDQVKENEYNYRVIRTSINHITRNTRCYRNHRDGINSVPVSDEDNFEFPS